MFEAMIAIICMTGPRPACLDSACLSERRGAMVACVPSDLDGDGDVDLRDVARWLCPPVMVTISGRVTLEDGTPVEGVTITATP